MLKARFLDSVMGSEDGIKTKLYKKDTIHDISEDLALQFLHRGAIELLEEGREQIIQTQNLNPKIMKRKGKK